MYVSPRETGRAARSVGVSGLPAYVQGSSEKIILEKGDKLLFLVHAGDVQRKKKKKKKFHGSRETRPKAQFSASAGTPPPSWIKARTLKNGKCA